MAFRAFIYVSFALLLSGCGKSDGIIVTGQLKWNGEPYKVDENEQIAVIFHPEPAGEKKVADNFIGEVDKSNGAYKVAGPKGGGIPAGKYRVAVMSVPMIPKAGGKTEDKFKGAFSPTRSPHIVEVAAGKNAFDLELNASKAK